MIDPDGSSSDEDDFGPMPAAVATTAAAVKRSHDVATNGSSGNSSSDSNNNDNGNGEEALLKRKKVRKLEFEQLYTDNIPKASYYESSYMHRDVVTHIAVSKQFEFIITASRDGHVKFWKKMQTNIEFVKHYQAHLGAIHDLQVSLDGSKLVTTSCDQMIKFFEVAGFDMYRMIVTAEYVPNCAVWISESRSIANKVAVSDVNSGVVRIYSSEGSGSTDAVEYKIHLSPVSCMAAHPTSSTVLSVDQRGMIEYWNAADGTAPAAPEVVSFSMKSDTDLYAVAKAKTRAFSIAMAPNGTKFALFTADKQIRVFSYRTGKLLRCYDESIRNYSSNSSSSSNSSNSNNNNSNSSINNNSSNGGLDELELGKRISAERELEAATEFGLQSSNLIFDESSNFLLFGSLRGVKVVNLTTNKIAHYIGSNEHNERFLYLALYQGVPKVDQQFLLSRSGADAAVSKTMDQLNAEPAADPTVYCSSFKRRRFYCLSNREPGDEGIAAGSRDVLNELPTEEERSAGAAEAAAGSRLKLSSSAVLHTNLGDIHLKLFPEECPRTVENFVSHCRSKYFDNVIFHRVIKGFMVQTGDPLGNGTGGESIWGGEFEDEFVKTLKHDRPFTVSMANAGPNTNGSQFFITTVPTPWLDNKHTVFGRVTKGFEVVSKIESAKANKMDKPYDDIKILSADA